MTCRASCHARVARQSSFKYTELRGGFDGDRRLSGEGFNQGNVV
jgi:hypothetical protein